MEEIMVRVGSDQGEIVGWADDDTALVQFLGDEDPTYVPVSMIKQL